MCGDGCLKVVEQTATNKRKSRFLTAFLIEKDGEETIMATNGHSTVKIDFKQYLEKTGAKIIEP